MGRVARENPAAADAIAAAALCALSMAQVLVDPIASRPVSVLVAVVSTVPIAFRRRYPVVAAVVGTAIWLVPTPEGFLFLGYLIAALLFFTIGTHVTSVLATCSVVVVGCVAGVVSVLRGPEQPPAAFGAVLAVALPVVVGRLVARQRFQNERLAELAEQLRRERSSGERAAAAEERARIARELHDVVGHDVSVIALQADAAGAALDSRPELARAPVEAIRESATSAMREMRRVLRSWHDEEGGGGGPGAGTGADDESRHPQPGIAELPSLVDRARRAGSCIDVVVDGESRPVPASTGLAVYRVVQEALTNARRHAPGAPVHVSLTWAPESVRVVVRDDGPGPDEGGAHGYGIAGMRERLRLLDGALSAGPAPTGGFHVEAELPLPPRSPG